MKTCKIFGISGLVAFASLFADVSVMSGSQQVSVRFLNQAEARVGRPVTPVSVAGVARRTVRRCAVGVYYCKNNKEVVPVKSSHAKVVTKS